MAGRNRNTNAVRCQFSRADGGICNQITPPGWGDYCVVHAQRRGEQLLEEITERVKVTIEIPRFPSALGGLRREEWEATRICMMGIVLPPPEPEPDEISARREAMALLGMPAESAA